MFGVGDQSVVGAPPQPGDYIDGMLWLHVYKDDADATGMTVGIDAYSYTPVHAVDWGDGVQSAAVDAVVTAGAGGAPNAYTFTHQYTGVGIRRGYVENNVRARFSVDVGKVRVLDPLDRDKTAPGYQKVARDRDLGDTRRTLRHREGRV